MSKFAKARSRLELSADNLGTSNFHPAQIFPLLTITVSILVGFDLQPIFFHLNPYFNQILRLVAIIKE